MLQPYGISIGLKEHSNPVTPKAYTLKSPSGPLPLDSGSDTNTIKSKQRNKHLQALRTNTIKTNNEPLLVFMFTGYGVCSLRQRWKLLRKLSNLHMLGGKAVDDWAQVRNEEIGYMLRAMHDCSKRGEAMVVAVMLTYSMTNMIGSESNEFKDMVVELMTVAGYFNIGDFIPFLAKLDLQGIERGMKQLHKKFNLMRCVAMF
ncbi:hypothetical protein JHK82_055316 [Glycine max]|nr:hypothetical protein JHK86_055155 [Glycine max]KAG5073946.1 hypothetical protein JHK84_055177 [Glycine max]KAG5076621.1 hypothetical protein JHK82_055316 [Glycine max]